MDRIRGLLYIWLMKREISSVCVYCGTGAEVDPVYKKAAADTGRILAEGGLRLVYGGENLGLMGIIAAAALGAGGKVSGIIPECLTARETGLTELVVVRDMHERKRLMIEKSDSFLILPGGFGTLDEAFETLATKYMGLHDKPVLFLNIGGYFDPLFRLIDHMVEKKFTPASHKTLFKIIQAPAILLSELT